MRSARRGRSLISVEQSGVLFWSIAGMCLKTNSCLTLKRLINKIINDVHSALQTKAISYDFEPEQCARLEIVYI